MFGDLLIEVDNYSTNLDIYNCDGKINFGDYSETLGSTFSGLKLYKVTDEYYDDPSGDSPYKELVGYVHGRYIDVAYAIDNGISMLELLDVADSDTSSLIPYLLDDNNEIKTEYDQTIYSNIYYLDRLFISEKYRGQGFAKFLLDNLADILMYVAKIEFGLIVIQAQPFDVVNGKSIMDCKDNDRKERLIKLYENSGYIRINDSNYLYQIHE